jgi:hypothetical protein
MKKLELKKLNDIAEQMRFIYRPQINATYDLQIKMHLGLASDKLDALNRFMLINRYKLMRLNS